MILRLRKGLVVLLLFFVIFKASPLPGADNNPTASSVPVPAQVRKTGIQAQIDALQTRIQSPGAGLNSKSPTSSTPPDRETAIQAKIDALQTRIQAFTASETSAVAAGLNVSVEQLKARTDILQEILALYNRQLLALGKSAAIAKAKSDLQKSIATGEALKLTPPPYSLKIYDDYTTRLTEDTRNKETAGMAVAVAKKSLESLKQNLKEANQQIRQIKEEDTKKLSSQEKLLYQWRLEQAVRKAELIAASQSYQELVLANAKEESELADMRAGLSRQILDRIRANLHFDSADLDKELASLDDKKNSLQEETKGIFKKMQSYELLQLKIQRKLEKTKDAGEIGRLKASLDTADQWRQTYQTEIEQNESTQQLLNLQKQIWQQRYDLIKGAASGADLKSWAAEATTENEKLQRDISLEQGYQTNFQLQINKLEEQLDQKDLDWDTRNNLDDLRKAYRGRAISTFHFLTILNITNQMYRRLIEEINRSQHYTSLWSKVQGIFATIGSVWKFEVLVVDEQSITIGKIITALLILIFGIIITGLASRIFQKRILGRFRMSTSAAAITGKLLYYIILLLVVLFAMRVVNIPLTVFTFFGGALAIGFGFGAQKLINNFISGFIIMVEQPIKVGDLIQMDNELGWIDDIGARSTMVRTFSNIHILVPNSYFLENNIINWTHNDNIVRGLVTVGVAYGTPTREVKRVLIKATKEHGEILKNPSPYVLLKDFGDNALIFELYFWARIKDDIGLNRIASDIRFMIDEFFIESKITIAFPQRDIHFAGDVPLKLEISKRAAQLD